MKKFTLLLLSLLFVSGYAQTVIDPLLRDEMASRNENEPIEVIVIMKAKYDRELLNRRADHFVSRARRREFVVNELKEFASASQYDLRYTLSEMERNGIVSAPTTLWITVIIPTIPTKKAAPQNLA